MIVIWQLANTGLGPLFGRPATSSNYPGVRLRIVYVVIAGDTVSGIAGRFGVSAQSILDANHLSNPDMITIGERLVIPSPFHPGKTRRLIRRVARRYGVAPPFALAIADQESGFNENAVSKTGAIGVMQIEPATGAQLSTDLGRTINLGNERDNVTAGVYYLGYLVRYYGGNERKAAAAYYEGQGNLAKHGYVGDTGQYVATVMALRSRYGGS